MGVFVVGSAKSPSRSQTRLGRLRPCVKHVWAGSRPRLEVAFGVGRKRRTLPPTARRYRRPGSRPQTASARAAKPSRRRRIRTMLSVCADPLAHRSYRYLAEDGSAKRSALIVQKQSGQIPWVVASGSGVHVTRIHLFREARTLPHQAHRTISFSGDPCSLRGIFRGSHVPTAPTTDRVVRSFEPA